MSDKLRKRWYQKGAVQGAFVTGVFGVVFVFLYSRQTSQVVVLQPPTQATTKPAAAAAEVPGTGSETIKPSPSRREQRSSLGGTQQATKIPKVEHPPGGSAAQAASEVGQPKILVGGKPWYLSKLSTAISATFRETLGNRYVEFTVVPPGGPSIRFPARNAGSSGRFSVGNSLFEIQVLAIDWNHSQVDVIVREVLVP